MAVQLQLRRGNEAENDAFTGAVGEVTVDLTNLTLRLHDGVIVGGVPIATTTGEQTLENKTLDSPTLQNPTLLNPTIVEEISGDLIPASNEVFDLGSETNRWKDLFLSGNTINLGGATISVDGSGNFLFKDSTGEPSAVSLDANDTDDLDEGSGNLYFTDVRARNSVSASGDLNYNSTTGEFSVTTYKSTDFDTDFATKTTTDLTEGSNLYFTTARIDSHLSGGTGVTYTAGEISIGQSVGTSDSVQFAQVDADNIRINNNTIASTNTNGSIILSPDGDGVIDVSSSKIINLATPISPSSAATKSYVDEVAQGLNVVESAFVLVDEPLSATYDDDGFETGWATLEATANGAFPAVDDVASEDLNVEGARILITAQTNAAHNGIYVLIVEGDAGTPWKLRRCQQCRTSDQIPGSFVFTKLGTVYANTGWVATVDDVTTFEVGTDDIIWTQFSGAGTFLAGTGLTLDGNEFSVNSSLTHVTELGTITAGIWNASTIAVNRGGTGQTSYTNGQLLIGNTTGNTLTKATLTAGSNITITNGAGSISIAAADTNLGVTAGTTDGPIITSSTGTNATLPTASASASGVITTGNQTFAGTKTFNSTISGSIDGNAATATALATARTINDVSFDGTANITISAQATNTNTQLASLGVGTAASGTTGEIRATDDITAFFSDDRLKTRLGNIEDAIQKVQSLATFYYEPNETAQDLGYGKKRYIGLSAQEVQKVVPEVVKPAPIDEQYLTVQYEKLVPLLVAAIKEQQQQIEELKQQINLYK